MKSTDTTRPTSNEIEAANRAEATALLVRSRYRVYRPEADCEGEDLVLRTPQGELIPVQLKSRMTIDRPRYRANPKLWMLFPEKKYAADSSREWYLVPHGKLYDLLKNKHGHAPKWNDTWSSATVPKDLRGSLRNYVVRSDKDSLKPA